MRNLFLVTASLLALGTTHTALAASAEDAAYNKGDKPIYDSKGQCVRTKWVDASDPCAPAVPPAPAPAPKPVAAPAPAPVPQVSLAQRTVYFDFDKATLTADGTAKLDQLANTINASKAIFDVSIHGYTDQLGTNSYNDALAAKRAKAVKAYLETKSTHKVIEGDIRGLGKSETDGKCKTIKKRAEKIACMAPQRRVEIEFKAQE